MHLLHIDQPMPFHMNFMSQSHINETSTEEHIEDDTKAYYMTLGSTVGFLVAMAVPDRH
jgi:hypothetical protein